MRLIDRAVIGVLSLVLIVLTGAVVAPSLEPSTPNASPSASLAPMRPYTEGIVGSATSASPFAARSAAEREMVALLFRSLVRLGPDDTYVGDLAEEWTVDAGGATWTFQLKPDLQWQDGEPITSADVAFTIRALSDPAYTGPGAASWRDVAVSTPDPRTVVMTLSTPLGGFLAAATQPIAPAHLLEGVAPQDLPDDDFGQHPIGSGAFRLAALDAVHALLVPSIVEPLDPGAGGPGSATPPPTDSLATPPPTAPGGAPLPYLDAIELRFFETSAALKAAWNAGDLDGATGLAPADAAGLAAAPDVRLLKYPTTTLLAVTLNLRPAHPEFRDATVRKALLQAIDRDAIIQQVLSGQAHRADGLIPPSSWAFDATASPPTAFDGGAAIAGLKAAGWTQAEGGAWTPKGAKEPLTIDLLSPQEAVNPMSYAVAQAVAASWRAIGLTVTVTPLPGATLVNDHLRTGEFSSALVGIGIGLDPDLYPFLASSQTVSTGSNFAGLQDPALDSLLVAARAPGDDATRKASYVALQTRLAAGTYLLPIAFRDEVVAVRDVLTGPQIRPVGGPGDRFWDVLTWRLLDDR